MSTLNESCGTSVMMAMRSLTMASASLRLRA